ncbi:MAG: hypothetical protein AB8F78_00040 [Saprospiraceae bacterium]
MLLLSMMASFGATTLRAQHTDITFNPMSALLGTAVVMVEIPVSEVVALELQSSYFFRAQRFWTQNYRTEGYRIGALAHLYMNEEAEHAKWSVFAYSRFLNVRYEAIELSTTFFERDSYTLSQMSIGLGGSYKQILGNDFVLSVGAGLGRNFARRLVREEGQTGDFLSLGNQATRDIDLYGRITFGYRLLNK